MMKGLRPFVDFNFDLRKSLTGKQKAKISRYAKTVAELSAQPHQIYRPRNKENLSKAQISSAGRRLKEFRVAFIGNSGTPGKIKIRKDSVAVETQTIISKTFKFNAQALLKNPEREVARIVAAAKGKRYAIQVGKYRTLRTFDATNLASELNKWSARYKHFGKFVGGVVSFTYRNQKSFKSAEREFLRERAKWKPKNRNARRRLSRKGRN